MSRFTHQTLRTSIAAAILLVVAACNQKQPESATEPTPTPAATEVAPATPAPAVVTVASVKYGRYVEPKTFLVGGVGTKFKATDQLYAAVQLEGTAPTATVQVRVLDGTGQPVAEQGRTVEPKKPMKVNFALSKAAPAPIAAGTYTAETLLDGQVVNTVELIVE